MKKYVKQKLDNLLIVNNIITIHYFEFDRKFTSKVESHNFWELVYVDKGEIICTSNDKACVLKKGEVLFHKPNERHSLSSNGIISPNVYIVSFDCRSNYIDFFNDKKIVLDKNQVQYIYNIIETGKKTFDIPYSDPETKKMKLLDSPTLGGKQIIKNLLELFLIDIMRSSIENNDDIIFIKQGNNSKLVEDIIRILQENLYSNVSIEELCELTSYSKAHIFKQFKKATGESVMKYFLKMKIDKSKELLRNNELSIKQIADVLSFDTPNYYTKVFKKFTHITPTAYKKQRQTK